MPSPQPGGTDRPTGSEASQGSEAVPARHVDLNLEFMSDGATRACIAAGRLVTAISLGLLAFVVVAKFALSEDGFWKTNAIVVMNMAAASLCMAALLGAGAAYVWRILAAVRAHKEWSPYQRCTMRFVCTQLVLQLLCSAAYLAPNAYLLVVPCSWHLLMNDIFLFVRWTCWVALFFSMVVRAASMLPARLLLNWLEMFGLKWILGRQWPTTADDLMVYDLSSRAYIPLLVLLWMPAQACVTLLSLWQIGVLDDNATICTSLDDPRCVPPDANPDVPCKDWSWTCESTGATSYILTAITGFTLLAMLGIYFFLMHVVRRELAKLPYTKHRVANLLIRFQMQVQTVMCVVLTVCIVTMWWIESSSSCLSYVFNWFGMPSMQVLFTCIVVLNAIYTIPLLPTPQQQQRYRNLHSVLWREGDALTPLPARVPIKLNQASSKRWWSTPWAAARLAAPAVDRLQLGLAMGGEGSSGTARCEPVYMFCFETALKSLYWSSFMYNFKEGEAVEDSPYSLDVALGLFNLQHHKLLWDPKKTNTKCMVAWGDDTILVAFRGTASLANLLADLKAWRTVHPPKRGIYWLGTQPMVHKGFLDAYTAEGHSVQIMQQLRAVLAGKAQPGARNEGSSEGLCSKAAESGSCSSSSSSSSGGGWDSRYSSGRAGSKAGIPQREWRVICIGHSLGGALATLASYDIAKEAERLRRKGWSIQVKLYTFGAPRPGNHAFAREFIQAVPNSWDIVHSDDAVAKQGKLLVAYKRAANRAVITSAGDLLPHPSTLEANLHRGRGASINQHFLRTYARSFAAVIRGQFSSKALDAVSRTALRQLVACRFVRDMMLGYLSFRARSLWRMRFASGKGQALLPVPALSLSSHPQTASSPSACMASAQDDLYSLPVSFMKPAEVAGGISGPACTAAHQEQLEWLEEVLAQQGEADVEGGEGKEEEERHELEAVQSGEQDFDVATGERLHSCRSLSGGGGGGEV